MQLELGSWREIAGRHADPPGSLFLIINKCFITAVQSDVQKMVIAELLERFC